MQQLLIFMVYHTQNVFLQPYHNSQYIKLLYNATPVKLGSPNYLTAP